MGKDLYSVPAHRYDLAGTINKITGGPIDDSGNYTKGMFAGTNANMVNGLGAAGVALGGMAGSAIAGGRESAVGNVIGGLGDVASAIPGPWGAVAGAGLKVVGGLVNAAFGAKLNQENINNVNNNINEMNSFKSNASSFDTLADNFNSQPTAMRFNQSYIGKNGWFNHKATDKYNELVAQQDSAKQFVDNSLTNNMNNLVTTQNQNMLANYAAQGGPLSTQGADWTTGLNFIGAGGSHESNPYDGVQMGIAPDGLPNLVEEGEVIWNNDYVFSKRLKVNKSDKERLKLGYKDKPLSFADAALKLNKEMDEMPNDPIAKRSRDAMLGKLAEVQEEKREKIQAREQRKNEEQALLAQQYGIPTAQMGMQEPSPEEQMAQEQVQQPIQQETPEQYMEQQTAQGMPLESMYAAKGGPIGHKYALGTPPFDTYFNFDWNDYWNSGYNLEDYERLAQLAYKQLYGLPHFKNKEDIPSNLVLREGGLGKEYYNWLSKLSNEDYQQLLNKIYPNKGDIYNKFIDDRVGLFNWANTGNPSDAYNGIFNAAPHLSDRYLDGKKPSILNEEWYRSLPVVVGNTDNDVIIPKQARNATTDVPTKGSNITTFKKKDNINDYYDPLSRLRFMPAIGSGIALFGDLLGLTNRPDYSAANAIARAASGLRDVSFTPLGDYAKYTPVDRMMALNQLNAVAGGNRRAIINQSAGNRGTAIAGLLASDNNVMNNIGNTLFTAENANYDRYMKALAHNAEINKANSTGMLQADMANQRMDEVRARYNTLAADARMKALQTSEYAKNANYNNFFDNLGNIGIDAANRMDARWLANHWPGAGNSPTIRYPFKQGGKLNKKNRRRYII